MTLAALLALADSRLPAGGHAHSGAAEQLVTDRLVRDEASLATLLHRRLRTGGAVAAGLAAAACAAPTAHALGRLDDEADARTPSPAARAASRAQGRALARVAGAAWPSPLWAALPRAAHHPLAVGAAAAAVGATPRDAALVAAYLATTAPATAAQRLLGLDPVTVAAVLARLGPLQEQVADAAASAAAQGRPPAADADPLTDLAQTRHTSREDKLFAS
jgi:urease accessory protein